jgi:hypothetical protein
MSTRILLYQVVRAAIVGIIADKEIGFGEKRGVESDVTTIPLTWKENAFGIYLDYLSAVAQIPGQGSGNAVRPANTDEYLLLPARPMVRPFPRISICDRFEVALDIRARGKIPFEVDAQVTGRQSTQAQLRSNMSAS